MAERTVELKFKVDDQGSLKLEAIKGNINKVSQEISNMDKSLRLVKWDSIINLAERAYQAAERMYSFGKSVASAANDIERQSRILGLSTTEYQKLIYAAKMSDLQIEEFTTGIGIFSTKLEEARKGTGDVGRYLKAMGIDIESTAWKSMSLSEKIGEVADQFKSWEEGERKIAIARELFGRSGAAWIEMLNKGKKGIQEEGDALVKMHGVLGEVTLKAGSAAENEFKNLDTRFNTLKLSLASVVLKFTELAISIVDAASKASIFSEKGKEMELKNLEAWLAYGIKEGASGKFIEDYTNRIIKLKKELGLLFESELAVSHGPGYVSTYGKKPPPEISEYGGLGKEEFESRMAYSKLLYEAWREEYLSYLGMYGLEENELKERMSNSLLMYEEWKEKYMGYLGMYGLEEDELKERLANSLLMYEEWKEGYTSYLGMYGLEEDELKERLANSKLLHEAWLEEYTKTNELGETFAKNMGNAWNFNIKNIVTESKNMGDAIQKVFGGMADAFTSAVSKMISDWIIFGNITGKYEAGKGLFGWLASFGKSAATTGGGFASYYQHGGDFMVDRPTPIVVGEAGRERVTITPEGKMGGGISRVPINIINVVDQRQLDMYMASASAKNAILNIIGSQSGTVKRLLR